MNYHQVRRKHSFLAITLYFFFHLSFRTSVLDHRINVIPTNRIAAFQI